MSDRLLISLSLVPVVAGGVLLALLQRPPALESPKQTALRAASRAQPERPSAPSDAWVGVVSAESTAELAADSESRVARVFLRTGMHVNAGDKLLELDKSAILSAVGVAGAELGQRSSEVARAQSRLDMVKGRLDRVKAGAEWLSEQEVDNAAGELRVAEAELRAAKAAVGISQARLSEQKLRATLHTLVAPFEGTLVSADVDPGDSVSAGQVLARVFSVHRQVRFAMPRSFVPAARTSRVVIRTSDGKAEVTARIDDVRPEVDPAAQLVFATAPLADELSGNPAWLPGTPVEVVPTLPIASLEVK
jgi:RND family efflux transporter MFP subunit